MKQIRFSPTPTFHFETVRAMWYAPFNGGDYGEIVSAVSQVTPGDFESWYVQWSRLAEAVGTRGDQMTDPVSRGKAFLRASNYLRTAEFFLGSADPRRRTVGEVARARFDAGLEGLGVDVTRSQVPYDDAQMETIFLRSPHATANDVLVVHGGYDSTPEEMYFTIGAAAVERGYHVLIFEGPGQGDLLREYGLPFTPNWERPASVAIDSLSAHCAPDSIIGVGVSFGGHLLARAAAFEKRYDGIVLYDFFPGMLDAFTHAVPSFLTGAFTRMPIWMQWMVRLNARFDSGLRWAIHQGMWTFAVNSLPELVAEVGRYDDRPWTGRITADVLALVGEGEHFFDKNLVHNFAARLTDARSVKVREFTRAEGGELHCQNGAIHLAHEEIFDWIREKTSRRRNSTDTTAPTENKEGTRVG